MKCHVVGSSFIVRAMRRHRFIKKNIPKVRHAVSHFKSGFSFSAPIYSCQTEIIEKFRRYVPYSERTGTRDLLWRIYNDFNAVCQKDSK